MDNKHFRELAKYLKGEEINMAKKNLCSAGMTKTGVLDNAGGAKAQGNAGKSTEYNFPIYCKGKDTFLTQKMKNTAQDGIECPYGKHSG